MAPEAHALLGASSAKQWLGCPPSVRLVESMHLPDEGSSFAEEGTEAHALAELKLRLAIGEITRTQYTSRMRKHKKNEYYGLEMEEYTDNYVEIITGLAKLMEEDTDETTLIRLEQRVDFSEYVPEGFGTADAVLINGATMHVIDLKYGKGVEVSAGGNPQLRLYALGALNEYGLLYGIETVHMTIVQPRLYNVSSDKSTTDELVRWGTNYVKPRAQLAWEGKGEFNPGEDTCRWCRAKALCRARADAALSSARADFDTHALPDPDTLEDALPASGLLTEKEIARLLGLMPLLESWCKDVKTHALERAQEGTRYAGWKLVEGRATRKIIDTEAAMEVLDAAGVPAEDYLKPYELQGITALTKNLGKKRFTELLEPLVVKPAGKPVLVPEDDKRPEIGSVASAASDFAD